MTRQAIGLLDEFAGQDRSFFLFVHYFDPHYNYQRHPEFGFTRESAGRLDGRQGIVALRRLLDTLTPDEVRFLKDLYDEEIRFTDAGIGRLLTHLRTSGLYEDTLIIFTADHGEEFLERGWLGHTRTLYEELLRVPLLIRLPGREGQALVLEEPVSLVSIVPTVLDLLDIECVGCSFQAPSLSDPLSGRMAPTTPIFAEVDFRGSVSPKTALNKTAFKKAVLLDQFKLIRDETSQEMELYNLSRDPLEREDLSEARADLRKHMARTLQSWSERVGKAGNAPEEVDLPSEMLEML